MPSLSHAFSLSRPLFLSRHRAHHRHRRERATGGPGALPSTGGAQEPTAPLRRPALLPLPPTQPHRARASHHRADRKLSLFCPEERAIHGRRPVGARRRVRLRLAVCVGPQRRGGAARRRRMGFMLQVRLASFAGAAAAAAGGGYFLYKYYKLAHNSTALQVVGSLVLLALRRTPVCCLFWRSGQLRPSWSPMCPLRPKAPRPDAARYHPSFLFLFSPHCLNVQYHYNSTKIQ